MYTPQVITHPSTPLRPLLAFAGLPLHFPLLLTCHASRPDGMKSECYSSFVTETNGLLYSTPEECSRIRGNGTAGSRMAPALAQRDGFHVFT
ncbi:hypothetical protein K439DRAFT_419591 [Ramaria rubella]|nr:hypothetical protein K439DRAFT_419591 [Ramaria rubella]